MYIIPPSLHLLALNVLLEGGERGYHESVYSYYIILTLAVIIKVAVVSAM